MSKDGAGTLGELDMDKHPYIALENETGVISNIKDGTVIGYKYFDIEDVDKISVRVKSTENGRFDIYTDLNQEPIASIEINKNDGYQWYETKMTLSNGVLPIYFKYVGNGAVTFSDFSI